MRTNIEVERVRVVGGGRRRVEKNPDILPRLLKLVKDETGGDPMRENIFSLKDLFIYSVKNPKLILDDF